MTCVQDLPHGDMVSSRDLEYLQVLPTAKELLMNIDRGAPNGMKDNAMQLPSIREQNLVPKASAVTEIPRVKDGKRSLPSPLNQNMVEPRLQQQIYNPGSSTFQVRGTSNLTNAWIRGDTNASLTSEDFSAKEDVGYKLLTPQIPASVDGWVYVERPPMTWEDALKVAQKARETVFRARSTGSPLTSLPDRSPAAIPATSQASGKMNNSSQIHPGQGPTYSPLALPLPPKEIPSRISSGCVKARINAFESSVHQDPDLSMSKLDNEKRQAENSPAGTALAARDQRTSKEKLKKWEDRGRKPENEQVQAEYSPAGTALAARGERTSRETLNMCEDRGRKPEPASRNSAVREVCAKAHHDRRKGSSRENSSKDSIAKDKEVRLPDGCQASRLDKPASGGRLDSKDLTTRREFGDTRTAWRLPQLQDINVEALENQLKQSSITEKDFVSAVEGNVEEFENQLKQSSITEKNSMSAVEETVEALENQLKQSSMTEKDSVSAEGKLSAVHNDECGSFPDNLNCGLISQESAAMKELGDKVEERAVSVDTPLPVEEETIKTEDISSQDRKATPEAHVESQDLSKVMRPQCSMTNPKPAPSDLQKRSRYGESLEARKSLRDSLHPARKQFFIPATLNEKFEQKSAFGDRVTSNSMDEKFATAARQVDIIIFKEKSSTEFPKKKSPPLRRVPCEDKFHGRGNVSSANDSKILGHLGSGLKQVLSGAVILVGLFALWPKNGGPVGRYHVNRYHVVKAGETLSTIAPGQCNDPSSNFCRINPQIYRQTNTVHAA